MKIQCVALAMVICSLLINKNGWHIACHAVVGIVAYVCKVNQCSTIRAEEQIDLHQQCADVLGVLNVILLTPLTEKLPSLTIVTSAQRISAGLVINN